MAANVNLPMHLAVDLLEGHFVSPVTVICTIVYDFE